VWELLGFDCFFGELSWKMPVLKQKPFSLLNHRRIDSLVSLYFECTKSESFYSDGKTDRKGFVLWVSQYFEEA